MILLFAVLVLILIAYAALFVRYYSAQRKRLEYRKCLVDALHSVYERCSSMEDAYEQLGSDYEVFRDRYDQHDQDGLRGFLKKYVADLDSGRHNSGKKAAKIDPDFRDFVLDMLNHANSLNPFSDLPESEAGPLNTVEVSLKSKNYEMGHNALLQLASEIAQRNEQLEKSENYSRRSIRLTIVGMILTIVVAIAPFLFSNL